MIAGLGLDPGGTTGICLAAWQPGKPEAVSVLARQCPRAEAAEVLGQMLAGWGLEVTCAQIEDFRVSRRAARIRRAHSTGTAELVADLRDALRLPGIRVYVRPASDGKPWASDKRLKAAGLLDVTRGLPHARDAARHALYTAHFDGLLPDPLSKRAAGRS